jgi:hypothetical protein
VNGLFKELAREVEARFRRVDVLVEVEHQVVGDDAVSVAKKATRRWMRWISAGVRRERRSTRSV